MVGSAKLPQQHCAIPALLLNIWRHLGQIGGLSSLTLLAHCVHNTEALLQICQLATNVMQPAAEQLLPRLQRGQKALQQGLQAVESQGRV